MKKTHLILLTVFLNIALFSCTPQAVSSTEPKALDHEECCGNGGDIPPPPPDPGTNG